MRLHHYDSCIPEWSVEGRAFAEFRLARAFAFDMMLRESRDVAVMQDGNDGLPPFLLMTARTEAEA